MQRPTNRPAFTLIELLVVVFVIAILIAILLPAVQYARLAVARTSCQNNLKSIAQAALTYENEQKRFPSGYLGPMPNLVDFNYGGQGLGVLALILPYMEQENVLRPIRDELGEGYLSPYQLNNSSPGAPDWRERDVTNTAAGTNISTFLCPADIADQDVAFVFTLLHTYIDPYTNFSTLRATGSEFRPLGRTNYLGVAGYLGRLESTYDGIFCNRTTIRMQDLINADGAGNTLMFGEVTVGYARFGGGDQDPQAFAYGWMGCGGLPTGWGLPREGQWYTFGSKHEGICYFAFGDGSVRALRTGLNNSENLTYIFLSGWHDGSDANWTSLE